MEIKIKSLPEAIIYYKVLQVKNHNDYFEVIPAIGKEVTKANPKLKCSTPFYSYIEYLDKEYRRENMKIKFPSGFSFEMDYLIAL